MSNLIPAFVTLAVTLAVAGIIAFIARDTRNKLVGKETRESTLATYSRWASPSRIEAQLRAREERLRQARAAHKIWCWCASATAAVTCAIGSLLATAYASAGVVQVAVIVIGASAWAALTWRLFRHIVTFPPLPERAAAADDARADDEETSDVHLNHTASLEGTVTPAHTRATVKRSSPAKRARRKAASASRRTNRR